MHSRFVYLLFLLLIILTPSLASATRYWVAMTGNDANACSAVDGDVDPGVYKATPEGGQACLTVAGDRLTIKAGTYTGALAQITSLTSGTSGNHTIVEGDPADAAGCAISSTCSVILRPSSGNKAIVIDGKSHFTIRKLRLDQVNARSSYPLHLENGTDILIEDVEGYNTLNAGASASCFITGYAASFVTFRRIHAHDCGDTSTGAHLGMYIQGDDTIVEDSSIHDNENHGIQNYTAVSQSDGRPDRGIYRRNKIFSNGQTGLVLEGHDDQAYDNEIFNNGTRGMSAGFSGALRAKIYNNLIYNNVLDGIFLGQSGSASNSEVKNNIIFGHTTEVGINSSNTTGITQANNACASGDACGTTGKLTIAALTDCTISTSDFRLKAASSCVGAGTSVSTRGSPNGAAVDIGPYEVPVFSVCTVEDGDASKIRVTFDNDVAPPLLPPTGITGFTARKAGANNVITSAVRTGDSRVDLTLTTAIVNGDAVDISYSGAGNLTATATVSGSVTQPYNTVLTNQPCTNNVGAAASHTFTQATFEYHAVQGTEAAPVMKPDGLASTGSAENVARMEVAVGGSIRVRFSVLCGTADCPPTAFIPRYTINSTDPATAVVVPDTFGAGNIGFCGTSPDPDIPINGTATTNQLSGGTGFVAGAFVRTSNAIPTVDLDHTTNTKTEFEYCFSFDTDITLNTVYRIYIFQQDGSQLTTYTNVPVMTLVGASGGAGFSQLWDLMILTMLPMLGRIEAQTMKPLSNLTVSYPSLDQVLIEGTNCSGLKTTGTGTKRTVACLH